MKLSSTLLTAEWDLDLLIGSYNKKYESKSLVLVRTVIGETKSVDTALYARRLKKKKQFWDL